MSLDVRTPTIHRSTDASARNLAPIPRPPVRDADDASTAPRQGGYVPTPADAQLVADLRDGNEAAFLTVIDRFGATMLRVARLYVSSPGGAEEVVQEAWLAVLVGLAASRRAAPCEPGSSGS